MAEEEGHKVTLNVYDLSQGLASQISMTLLGKVIEGVWHTGVEVYGTEYYFGGGIQRAPVGVGTTMPYGRALRVVDLGVTHVPKDVFEAYLQEIGPRYTAQTYSLMTHNCNNFSNEVAQFLVGTTIPDYILNLPNEVMNSPMGPLMLPMIQQLEATLSSGAVPQASQFKQSTVVQTSELASAVNKCSEEQPAKDGESMPLAGKLATAEMSGVNDPLGDARSKVQQEISNEFASLMAAGSLGASEAATLAIRRVMERYGILNTANI